MSLVRTKFLLCLPLASVLSHVATAQTPDAPVDFRAWPESEATIGMAWEDLSANESGFRIERRVLPGGTWETIADSLPADTVAYTDSGLVPDFEYAYRLHAFNDTGSAYGNLAMARTDDRTFGNRTLYFQKGMNAYNGALDIGIRENNPDSNSKSIYVWIDNNGDGGDNQALMQFADLFGGEGDRVPPAASIVQAKLRIYLGTNSNSQSYKPVSWHRMLVSWDAATTWSSEAIGGDGLQADDSEALADYDDVHIFGTPGLYYEIDVTSSLQAWANGAAQSGWLVRTSFSDGFALYTSHNSVLEQRPRLLVTYDTDPANGAPQFGQISAPVPGQTGVHEPATIEVEVSDPDSDPLTVTLEARPTVPVREDDFSVILLPDTQNYAAEINGAVKEIFFSQTDWIVEHHEELNIPFVLHMGDITQSGDIKSGGDNGTEWLNAAQAMYRLHRPDTTGLEEGIPFAVNVGNHDQEPIWRSSGTTFYFNQYFGASHFDRYSYYGGHYGDNNDNHYYLFKAGGMDFIVISLEYTDPARDPVDPGLLEWADALLKEYQDHRGIIVSHHMVNPGDPALWSPYGEVLYQVLKDNPNLFLMLGGHVTGEGIRTDTHEGHTVYSMVQDYQGLAEGGAGYLRLLTFSPRRNKIFVDTYSPWLDAFYEDFGGAFSLDYEMTPGQGGFSPVMTLDNHIPGTPLRFDWDQLDPMLEYDWRLTASDGRKETVSEVSWFRTAARTYSDWRTRYFADQDPDGERGEDPDLDGYINFMEFLFLGHPLVAGHVEVPLLTSPGPAGSTLLEYTRPRELGLEWEYEVSPDLKLWQDPDAAGIPFSEETEDQENGFEAVRITIGAAAPKPVFWRVRASLLP